MMMMMMSVCILVLPSFASCRTCYKIKYKKKERESFLKDKHLIITKYTINFPILLLLTYDSFIYNFNSWFN